MLLKDKDGDGSLTFEEMIKDSGLSAEQIATKKAKFVSEDKDKDGKLNKDELFELALDLVKTSEKNAAKK
jgi:Ca2+-binding EF-hand superfamily protein